MVPAALAKLITEPPPPSLDDEEGNALYWSREPVAARARRRRLRLYAGSAALAALAIAVAVLAFVVRVDPAALIVGLHVPFIAAALVLLAVPGWRRWLLVQPWSPILFVAAVFGAFYVAALWPNALGGWSVGLPLALALIAGVLVGSVWMLIKVWRSDRRSAIDGLVLVAVLSASLIAAERFVGKEFWWLAIVPVLGYSAICGLVDRHRSRRREPS